MRIVILAAALLAGTAAHAQPPAGLRPSPELMTAMQAWGQCMDQAVGAVPATEEPQAAARRVIASCASLQQSLTSSAESWIASANLSTEQQAQMRQRLGTVSSGLEPRVIERIQQLRAQPGR